MKSCGRLWLGGIVCWVAVTAGVLGMVQAPCEWNIVLSLNSTQMFTCLSAPAMKRLRMCSPMGMS